jgi:hypothetical protein
MPDVFSNSIYGIRFFLTLRSYAGQAGRTSEEEKRAGNWMAENPYPLFSCMNPLFRHRATKRSANRKRTDFGINQAVFRPYVYDPRIGLL